MYQYVMIGIRYGVYSVFGMLCGHSVIGMYLMDDTVLLVYYGGYH